MISKEQLVKCEEWAWDHSHGNTEYMKTKAYGRALLKAVERECEVVGWMAEDGFMYEVEQHRLSINGGGVFPNQIKLIALPLVEGD